MSKPTQPKKKSLLITAKQTKAEVQLGGKLLQAEKALRDGAWEEAKRLYQEVLETDEHHQPAQRGLQLALNMEQAEKKVVDLISKGDISFEAEEYRQAADRYTDAWNAAGQSGVVRYIGELEQKRSLALDLAKVRKILEYVVSCYGD